jgi:hypothetical protein
MRIAGFLAAVLLAACATSAPAEPTSRVTVEISSWGYLQERWSITATGEASLERVPEGGQLTTPTVTQTFTTTPQEFEQVRAALAPAEPLVDNLNCERVIYDLPYGTVTWLRADGTQDAIRFDVGCRPNPGLDTLFDSIEAARVAFDAATAP